MTYVRDIPPQFPTSRGSFSPFVWVEPVPLRDALARRLTDVGDAVDFLDERERSAPDPHLLPGMTEAVERVARALRRNEPIGIFGDYDTDGVTSAALLMPFETGVVRCVVDPSPS